MRTVHLLARSSVAFPSSEIRELLIAKNASIKRTGVASVGDRMRETDSALSRGPVESSAVRQLASDFTCSSLRDLFHAESPVMQMRGDASLLLVLTL